jgi:hypothetical protein
MGMENARFERSEEAGARWVARMQWRLCWGLVRLFQCRQQGKHQTLCRGPTSAGCDALVCVGGRRWPASPAEAARALPLLVCATLRTRDTAT